ncbi:hypothetical protein QF031_002257 [Pseudarthrobacter defluvii]|uniref:hypothetical protein n=1 Tax=Pseudarthrobacter defluvii TaxID=410837 RepID=UPI0027803CD5|nr:hypothetical protein [Pseudarthrobacter defluvii]MDQ0769508.1 hypothetical protein [Pseudarthrobacter defluvii]
MEAVPAAALWVLTILRLPAALDPERGSVFRATILAAIACTLYVPAVYYWGDPLLGGRNRIGLVTLLSLLLGFWQFRTAMLLAAVPDAGVRRRQLALGRWVTFAACTAVTAGFLGSRVDTTDPNLPLRYGDQPGMAVFLWTGSAFIMWVCLDIAWACRSHIPRMGAKVFRSAFTLIAGGCVLFALVLLDRLLYGIVTGADGADSPTAIALTNLYWIGETFAVLLVSFGLLLPRMAGRLRHGILGLRARVMLVKIGPIWNNVAYGRHELVLQNRRATPMLFFCRHAQTQLHRRLVEIRDCEMANPVVGNRLGALERSIVEAAERELESRSRTHTAS